MIQSGVSLVRAMQKCFNINSPFVNRGMRVMSKFRVVSNAKNLEKIV